MQREYVRQRVANGELAASSAEVILAVLAHWHRHVDHLEPNRWTGEHVQSWTDPVRMRPNTRKSRITKLRPYVRWLMRSGLLDCDPTEGIASIRIPPGTPRDLPDVDVRSLFAACPDGRAVLIVTLMVQLSLRCSDVARIRIEDVDARRRLLHVRAKGGRGEPTHWVPITTEAWGLVVRELRECGRSSGPLISSLSTPGEAISGHHISKLVGRWMRDAGLKEFPHDGVSAHALRHTCAQSMLDAGADLREVQFALGHRTIRSTEGYVRREPPGLRDAMDGRSYLPAA